MPALPKNKRLVPISEAAEILDVSIDTIRRWDKNGVLHSSRPDGKNRYFSIEELEKVKFSQPLSISEVVKQLGISASTLRRLEKKGFITPERNNNKERLYNRESIKKFLQSEYFLRQKEVEEKILEPLREPKTLGEKKVTALQTLKEQTTRKVFGLMIEEQRENTLRLLQFRNKFYLASLFFIIIPAFLILLIAALFLLFPEGTAKFFAYDTQRKQLSQAILQQDMKNAQVLGAQDTSIHIEATVLGKALKPFSQVSLDIVKQINEETYKKIVPEKKIQDVNDILTIDQEGNIKPKGNIVLPDPSALKIESKEPGKAFETLVEKIINKETIQQLVSTPSETTVIGIKEIESDSAKLKVTTVNKIATLSLDVAGLTVDLSKNSVLSEDIKDGEVKNADIADGAVTNSKLSQITTSNKIAGSALQLTTGGGLVDSSGLSLLRTCSSGQVLAWSGSAWACTDASSGSGTITSVTAGSGLTGGGSSGAVTLSIGAGTGITVNADDIAIDQSFSPTWTGNHTFQGNVIIADSGADTVTLGDTLDTLTISSTGLNVTSTGAVSGVTTLYALGNIGIGTSSPNYKVEVVGAGHITGATILDSSLTVSGTTVLSSLTNNKGLVYLTDGAGTLTSLSNGTTGQCLNSNTNGAPTWGSCSGAGGSITGSGTTNFFPLWTSSSSIGNADIYQSGTNIGIGTSAPVNKLDVLGSQYISGNLGIGSSSPLSKLEVIGAVTAGTYNGQTISSSASFTGTVNAATGYQIAGAATSGNYLRGNGTNFVSSSILYGDLPTAAQGWSVGSGNVYLTTDSNNVGIGTSAPATKFAVIGSSYFSGNVGIGSSSPVSKLEVIGNSNVTGTGTFGGAITGGTYNGQTLSSAASFTGTVNAITGFKVNNAATSGQYLRGDGTNFISSTIQYGDLPSTAQGWTTFSGNIYLTTDSNNVGIGTSAPTQKFQVNTSGANAFVVTATGNLGIGTTSPNAKLEIVGNSQFNGTGTFIGDLLTNGSLTSNGNQAIFGNSVIGFSSAVTGPTNGLAVLGNVGIGTSSPNYKLAIAGTTYISGDTQLDSALNVSGNTTFTGNLALNGGTMTTSATTFNLINATATTMNFAGAASTLTVGATTGTGVYRNATSSFLGNLGVGTSSPGARLAVAGGALVGYSGTEVAPTNGLAVFGNVGIGTTSPAAALQVAGNIRANFTNTATTNGVCHSGPNADVSASDRDLVVCSNAPGDIAEWYEVSGSAAAGDVMVTTSDTFTYSSTQVDPATGLLTGSTRSTTIPKLTKSTTTYQKTVLGIVSTSPYQVFGGDVQSQGTNPKPIAVTGRVLVKVNTENGNISQGDYLTTSSTAGVAMKATRPGQTIGKALEAYSSAGTGTIMIFVNVAYADPDSALSFFIRPPDQNTGGFAIGSGNVGIGTSTPGSSLQVNGGVVVGYGSAPFAAPDQGMVISGNVGIGTSNPHQFFQVNSDGYNSFVVTTSGNVGIGNTGPTQALDVVGNLTTSGTYKIGGTDVLSSTTLGSTIVNSSLTGVGVLSSGSITSNFGSINIGSNSLTAGIGAFSGITNVGGYTQSNSNANTFTGITTFSNGTYSAFFTGGNVGVGATAPGAGLQVLGNAVIGFGSGTVAGPSTGLAVNGNLGVGTTSPNNKLEVVGNSNITGTGTFGGAVTAGSLSTGIGAIIGGVGSFTSLTDSGAYTQSGTGANTLTGTTTFSNTTYSAFFTGGNVGIGVTAPGAGLQVMTNGVIGYGTGSILGPTNGLAVFGNIGIGTSSPATKLEVVGTSNITGAATFDSTLTVAGTTILSSLTNSKGIVYLNDAVGTVTSLTNGVTGQCLNANTGGAPSWGSCSGAASITGGGTSSFIPRFTSSSNIGNSQLWDDGTNLGIGTSSPGASLQIAGNTLIGYGSSNTAAPTNGLAVLGNVGIGTTSPHAGLDVVGTGQFSGALTLSNGLTVSSGTVSLPAGSISNATLVNSSVTVTGTSGLAGGGSVALGQSTSLSLDTTNANTWSGIQTFNANSIFSGQSIINTLGNLGIGTTAPVNKLDVIGSGYVSGNLGIGSSSPVSKLEVVGTSNVTGAATFGSTLAVTGAVTAGTYNGQTISSAASFTGTVNAATGYQIAGAATSGNYLRGNGTNFVSSAIQYTDLPAGAQSWNTSSGNVYLTIDSNSVGIGTSSPSQKLSVVGSQYLSGNIGIGTSSPGARLAVAGGGLIGYTGTQVAPTNGLSVFGNIGIGNTSPSQALSVLGSSDVTGSYLIGGTSVLSATTLGTGVTTSSLTTVGALTSGSIASGFGTISTGNTITTTGTMGTANTTTFTGATQTLGATGTALTFSGNGAYIYFTGNATNQIISPQSIGFVGGNVGIGTTNPTNKLDVLGAVAIGSYAGATPTAPANGLIVSGNVGIGTSTVGTAKLAIFGGNVGIGTSSPGAGLQIATNGVIGYGANSIVGPSNGLAVLGNIGIGTTSPRASLEIDNPNGLGAIYISEGIAPTADLITINSSGVITAGISAMQITYGGGAAAVEASAYRTDLTPGSTSGGTWNGFRFVANAGGPATGITENGIKLEGPNSAFAGIFNGIILPPVTTGPGSGGAYTGINIGPVLTPGVGTEIGLLVQSGWDTAGAFLGNVGIGTTNPNTARLAILGGNVGIGTSSPGATLQNAGNEAIGFGAGNLSGNVPTNGLIVAGNVGIGASNPGTAKLSIIGGNVGIGTSSPGAGLQVATNGVIGYGSNSIAGPANGLTVKGNLGIGTSSPGSALHVVGGASFGSYTTAQTTGNVVISGNLGIGVSSPNQRFVVSGKCTNFQANATCVDYAEKYSSSEPVDTGEIVAVDSNKFDDEIAVKRSTTTYQKEIIGIVSTSPGAVLEGNAVTLLTGENYHHDPMHPAVALAGRVPLKVTGENGPIAVGDYVTSSSTPGAGMRALKPGQIVGKALEAFDGTGTGNIIVFVNVSYADPHAGLSTLEGVASDILLAKFIDEKEQIASNSASTLYTDRLAAGLEIVTPKVTTQELVTSKITSVISQGITLELDKDKQLVIKGKNASSSVATIDSLGNATFAGTITADKIKANQIEGLQVITDEVITDKISSLIDYRLSSTSATLDSQIATSSALTSQTASSVLSASTSDILESIQIASQSAVLTASISAQLNQHVSFDPDSTQILGALTVNKSVQVILDMKVLGKLTTEGGLIVAGPAEFKDKTIFQSLANFIGEVIFHNDVTFLGRPTFNKDTAGTAIIKIGADSVDVVFEQNYLTAPLVTVSVSLDDLVDKTASADAQLTQQEILQKQELAGLATSSIVTNRTTKGFTIKLNKPAEQDLTFSWIALAVVAPKTSMSKEAVPTSQPLPTAGTATPTPTLVPSPTPQPLPTVTPTPTISGPTITVNDNELGFLRVRSESNTDAPEVGEVKPGQKFPVLNEEYGWYKIAYEAGSTGWVSGTYVTVSQ